MIQYLIKNNLKMMLRNKWIGVLLILGPVLVIAVLSSAFEELMQSYEGVEEFQVGYQLSEDSVFSDYMKIVRENASDNGIVFSEYPEGNPEEIMRKNELAGFVVFEEDSYVIYQSEEHLVEGITLEYFVSKIVNQLAVAKSQQRIGHVGADVTEQSSMGAQFATNVDLDKMELPITSLSFMPAVDSKDYYGIAYIVYFIWCGIVCISPILASERKNGIDNRFRVSAMSDAGIYLAKWISTSIVLAFGMFITILICVTLYDITWGNVIWSCLILLLAILAANAFGLFIYYLFKNLAITVVGVFTTVWFMGFAGGSFETYMFSPMAQWIKELSPIYHINRALVEYSCIGSSEYTQSCIIYLMVLILVCSVGALVTEKMRRVWNK